MYHERQERRKEKTRTERAGEEGMEMEHGSVGLRGAYGAANEADLARHLAAELRKAIDAKNRAPRDVDGNLYLPVDYFVV